MEIENIQAQIAGFDPTLLKDQLLEACASLGMRIVVAILIYIIGKFIIGKLLKLFDKMQSLSKLDTTARSYIRTAVKFALYLVLIVSIVAELGVETASILTFIASCGVAISLALQGSLGNLAGGVMLLIFRPFNVGDYIIAGGEEGTVRTISIFYTVLVTVDNKIVSIPNGTLMNSTIVNASAEKLRRVDLTFNIAGNVPVQKVRATILGVVIDTPKAMADPAPQVEPLVGIPGGLQYAVRVWVETPDYWEVYHELMREIPTALGAADIGGPSTPVSVSK